MSTMPSLTISKEDFDKISSLLRAADNETADLLADELLRATVTDAASLPAGTVVMNSEVSFKDLNTGSEQKITLVYPQDANIDEGKISVLAPVGAAVIGLRAGQEIEWPLADGKTKRIKVLSVNRN